MKRIWLLACICGFLLALPATAALPIGSLGGISGGGTSGGGFLPLHGWCLDDDGVAAVDIYVDGEIAGRASYGTRRPDVERARPGFPDSANGGFGLQLNTARYVNGTHTVEALCISNSGERRFLRARTLEFTNTTHTLVPFGRIDFPSRNAQLFGNCNITDPSRRYSIVEGWALDLGVEIGDEGVSYVELLVDGSVIANTRLDCTHKPEAGGLTDCYGLNRQDIERNFPGAKDSPNAGFRFAMDIGDLLGVGYVRGFHVLTIRVGDITGQFANIDEIPVVFLCDDDVDNQGAFGQVGRPQNGQTHAGTMNVVGWALDWEGIREIDVHIDGESVGTAVQDQTRPVIRRRFPGFPNSPRPGFRFPLDTTQFENGLHQIQIFVIDNASPAGVTLIGERTFSISN